MDFPQMSSNRQTSSESKISRRRGRQPVGGGGGGIDLRRGRFSVKIYVKRKQLGPVGACARHAPYIRQCKDCNFTENLSDTLTG